LLLCSLLALKVMGNSVVGNSATGESSAAPNVLIYQLLPQPSHTNYTKVDYAEEYGYQSGEIIPNSGHLLVTVEENQARIDYVSAYHLDDPSKNQVNGSVRHSYFIQAEGNTSSEADMMKESANPFRIWQNSDREIWIHNDQNLEYEIRLYTMAGKFICKNLPYRFNNKSLKLPSGLPSGLYLLNLRTVDFSYTFKVVL